MTYIFNLLFHPILINNYQVEPQCYYIVDQLKFDVKDLNGKKLVVFNNNEIIRHGVKVKHYNLQWILDHIKLTKIETYNLVAQAKIIVGISN
jgi:hypothetical protein